MSTEKQRVKQGENKLGREIKNHIQPIVYLHQILHGEEDQPILLSRTNRDLVCTLYHLPGEKGVVCAYYDREWEKGKQWAQRIYYTAEDAESSMEIIYSDWHDARGVADVRPADWYETETRGTDLAAVQHLAVEEIGDEVVDPIQLAIDNADKISIKEFLERLKKEGVDI